jgi:acyl-CoA thioesterase-1
LTALFGAFDEADAKPILIVAIGADNVHGMGIGKRRTGGVPVSEAFPAQLQGMLRARGIDATVRNAGVGGDTTAGMLARLDSAVPEDAQLVIVDRANGNDKTSGLKAKQSFYLQQIKAHLKARHIATIVLPGWKRIPGAVANRDWDGHHFTAKGHASIARYLLPKVMALLGGQHSSSR